MGSFKPGVTTAITTSHAPTPLSTALAPRPSATARTCPFPPSGQSGARPRRHRPCGVLFCASTQSAPTQTATCPHSYHDTTAPLKPCRTPPANRSFWPGKPPPAFSTLASLLPARDSRSCPTNTPPRLLLVYSANTNIATLPHNYSTTLDWAQVTPNSLVTRLPPSPHLQQTTHTQHGLR